MWTLELNEIAIWLVLAFCGGMLGAAIGGLCTFVFCGLGAVVSSILLLSGNPQAAGLVDGWVTWGPLIGPQTAFVGGCWAAVYAKYNAGFENGRDICKPLAGLNNPKVLIVGGLGGVCGAIATWLCWLIPAYSVATDAGVVNVASTNSVACGVAIAAIIGRVIYGKTGVFGKVESGVQRWRGTDSICWIPWQHDKLQIMILSIMVGLPSAYLTYLNSHTHFLIFGVMCLLFLFMILGQAVIAGHHFAICAYFATAATGNVAWGLAAAILAGFLCEFFAFLFTAHGDSHIDPPTCSIAAVCLIQPLLTYLGLMPYAPMSGANTSENLMTVSQAFITNGNYSGIVALIVVIVICPLALHALRQLPVSGEIEDNDEQVPELG